MNFQEVKGKIKEEAFSESNEKKENFFKNEENKIVKSNPESDKSQSQQSQCLFMVKVEECHRVNLEAEYEPNISGIFDYPESLHEYEN